MKTIKHKKALPTCRHFKILARSKNSPRYLQVLDPTHHVLYSHIFSSLPWLYQKHFFYVCCFQYNYNPRTNLFSLDCLWHLSEFTFPWREPGMEKSWEPAMFLFCQRFTVVWHVVTFQHGRQNRNERAFEVTEVDNFRLFDGGFHAKRLDHPVQLARNTGRTGVFGRDPASKQKKNVRWVGEPYFCGCTTAISLNLYM